MKTHAVQCVILMVEYGLNVFDLSCITNSSLQGHNAIGFVWFLLAMRLLSIILQQTTNKINQLRSSSMQQSIITMLFRMSNIIQQWLQHTATYCVILHQTTTICQKVISCCMAARSIMQSFKLEKKWACKIKNARICGWNTFECFSAKWCDGCDILWPKLKQISCWFCTMVKISRGISNPSFDCYILLHDANWCYKETALLKRNKQP